MGRRDRLQETLNRLRELRDEPDSDARRTELRKALGQPSSYVVASVATLIADQSIDGLEKALLAAFEHFMEDPVKRDPGCKAKTAVVEALRVTSRYSTDVFLRGIRHKQMEKSWGPPVDTATELRSVSGFGLVDSLHPDALISVVDLLADRELPCRNAAAQAAGAIPHKLAAVALLRFKIRVGDKEPEVIGHCMDSLLDIDPEGSFELVLEYLNGVDPVLAECAALSLGTTRTPQAFEALKRWWNGTFMRDARAVGLVAISLIRDVESRDFLLVLVAHGDERDALEALRALDLYRHDEAVGEAVLAAAAKSDSDAVLHAARDMFSR